MLPFGHHPQDRKRAQWERQAGVKAGGQELLRAAKKKRWAQEEKKGQQAEVGAAPQERFVQRHAESAAPGA